MLAIALNRSLLKTIGTRYHLPVGRSATDGPDVTAMPTTIIPEPRHRQRKSQSSTDPAGTPRHRFEIQRKLSRLLGRTTDPGISPGPLVGPVMLARMLASTSHRSPLQITLQTPTPTQRPGPDIDVHRMIRVPHGVRPRYRKISSGWRKRTSPHLTRIEPNTARPFTRPTDGKRILHQALIGMSAPPQTRCITADFACMLRQMSHECP